MQIFLAVGSSFASARSQLLPCLPYLFFLISHLTRCDQQLLEGLAVCLSSAVARYHLSLISLFGLFCPLPIYHITFSLVPLSLLLSLRYSVLENNATVHPHAQMLCCKPRYYESSNFCVCNGLGDDKSRQVLLLLLSDYVSERQLSGI